MVAAVAVVVVVVVVVVVAAAAAAVVVVVVVVVTIYFFSIHEKLTAKQAMIMGKFAEVLAENQSKNVKRNRTIIRYNYMVLMKKTTQHLRNTSRSSRGSYLASTLIQDLQGLGQLQLALTLPDTPQRPMLCLCSNLGTRYLSSTP